MTAVASILLLPKTSPKPLKAKWVRHNYNLSLNLAADTRKKQCVTQYVLSLSLSLSLGNFTTVLIRPARNIAFSASTEIVL